MENWEQLMSGEWRDECGALYSYDRKTLLRLPDRVEEYVVKDGTEIVDTGHELERQLEWKREKESNPYNNIGGVLCLKRIVIPGSVKKIAQFAFAHLQSLDAVELAEGLKEFGFGAFADCGSLVSINIPGSLTSIGGGFLSGAFQNCTSLKEIKLPDGLTSIGASAFSGCTSLKEIKLPDSLTSIDGGFLSGAFQFCTSLKEIKLPDSLTSIGELAFGGCTSLKEVKLPAGLTSIEDGTFQNCTLLKEIKLPDGLTSIEDYAFRNCGFRIIDLPASVTYVGGYAFADCRDLRDIDLSNVRALGKGVLSGCDITVDKSKLHPKCQGIDNIDYYLFGKE